MDERMDTIGPYRVDARLGSGGMGEVLRAWDLRLDRPVAIKRLRTEVSSRESQRERLRREARAAAQLNHSAIVQIYDIIDHEGSDCIVMELVEGDTLATTIAAGIPSLEHALQLAIDIADGLAAAHARGLIHRDLKPGNVIETRDGRAKILDFGIAKRAVEPAMTREGAYIGTYNAMAPEQTLRGQVDHRTDLFAFGLLLYELFTGKHPFPAATPVATMVRISIDRHEPARSVCPTVPEPLSALIDRLLAKDAAQRPQSAAEVALELERMRDSTATSGQSAALDQLIDAFVAEGFPAKAIVMLKQLQRTDPARTAVDDRLNDLAHALSARATPADPDKPTIESPTVFTIEQLDKVPLFSHFSPGELTPLIQGLELQTHEAGDIVFTEGEPGDSLMVLASGTVRVFVRNVGGGNTAVRTIDAGAFFGEISLLTGKPRSATVVTSSACEVLVLGRKTVDVIAEEHPQVLVTLRELYAQRHDSDEEVRARIGPRTEA